MENFLLLLSSSCVFIPRFLLPLSIKKGCHPLASLIRMPFQRLICQKGIWGWGFSSSGRAVAQQAQVPKFHPQHSTATNKKEICELQIELIAVAKSFYSFLLCASWDIVPRTPSTIQDIVTCGVPVLGHKAKICLTLSHNILCLRSCLLLQRYFF